MREGTGGRGEEGGAGEGARAGSEADSGPAHRHRWIADTRVAAKRPLVCCPKVSQQHRKERRAFLL